MILRYFLAWFGMMVLAVLNGGLRDYAYRQRVGDPAAHQISTAALVVLLAAFIYLLARFRPLRSARQAWTVGVMWFLMTVVFEFGMGIAAGESWSRLLSAYNVFEGRFWVFVPLWVLAGPYLFFRWVRRT